jgi:flavin-dependent dehydrogenase
MTGAADLLVVGGGPAGLATALAARRHGLAVTVVDRGEPPRDKACGEGLMPDAVAALAALGVDPAALGGHPFRGIRYLDDAGEGAVAEADFPAAAGLGVRRTRLHAALVERAAAAGVELRWRTAVDGIERGAEGWRALAGGRPLAGRWLVAADGLHSRLRRGAGLAGRPAPRRRFGVRRHYRLALWSEHVEVWWTDGCEAYVTPVAGELVGVAVLWDRDRLGTAGFDALLARFPRLAARLAGAPHASRDRGAGPLEQRVRAVVSGNLALVGDAAGYVDAITGEGLALAFHQAGALAAALAAGDPAAYAVAHRRLARLPDGLTRLLLAVERRPRLRRRTIRALAAEPALFARLLAIHSRSLPLSELGVGGALRLAVGLVRTGARTGAPGGGLRRGGFGGSGGRAG